MRKKVLIILGVVVVVLVGGVALLLANLGNVINKNKDFLLQRAENTLGRRVSIGEIGVTLRGGLGVRLQDFILADDPEFSSDPFVAAKDLQVNVKILPLLRKEFEVKRIILREPMIRVIRDEHGNLNTSTIAAGNGSSSASAPPAGSSAGTAAAPLIVSLINIENGTLSFVDNQQNLSIDLTQINTEVTNLEFTKPIDLELGAALLADEPNLRLAGTFGPVGEPVDTANLPIDATLDIGPIDISALQRAMPKLATSLPPDLAIDGPLNVKVTAKGTASDLSATLDLIGTDLALKFADQFNKPKGVPLSVSTGLGIAPDRIRLEDTKVTFHTIDVTGKGEYLLGERPSVEFDFASNRASLAGLESSIPPLATYQLGGDVEFSGHAGGAVVPGSMPRIDVTAKLTDLSAVVPEPQNVSVSGTVNVDAVIGPPPSPGQPPTINATARISNGSAKTPQLIKPATDIESVVKVTDERIDVEHASLRVGESQLTGRAIVHRSVPPVVTYEATAPVMHLSDFAPPNPKLKRPQVLNELKATGELTAAETPVNTGELSSASGTVADFDYADLKGDFRIVGQEARLSNLEVKTLDGIVTGGGVVMMGDSPSFNINTQAHEVNVVKAMNKIPSVTKNHLTGKANLNLNVSGSGKEWSAIQPTISGDGLAELFDGAIVDVNLLNNIVSEITRATGFQNAISQGLRDKYPKVFKDKDTTFKDFKSSFVMENGKLLARNAKLNADDYTLTGQGAIGMTGDVSMQVKMVLSSALTADLVNEFKAAAYLKNNNGLIEVPFVLSGVLPKVSAKPDANFINSVVQKALSQEGQDLLKKGLKDLFGKD